MTAPYGSWPSPITARLAADGMSGGQIASPSYVDVIGGDVWWIEPRPREGGRMALMRRRRDGDAVPVLPPPWNPRSRVIEYGGRPWAAVPTGRGALVVFVNHSDQRLYAFPADVPGAVPRPLSPLSPRGGGLRWSDPEIDLRRGQVRCIAEEFTGPGSSDLRRFIAAVPLDGSAAQSRTAVRELSDGRGRFISSVRVSPDRAQALWLSWDHPHMPWDAAALQIADVREDGAFHNARTLVGGPGDPIAQAEWAADGSVLAAAERTGWWNLYRVDPTDGRMTAVHPADEDFAGLQRMGLRWFVPLADGRVGVLHGVGAQRLAVFDPVTAQLNDVGGEWTEWLPYLAASDSHIVGVVGSAFTPYEVVSVELSSAPGAATGHGTLGKISARGNHNQLSVRREFLPQPQQCVFKGRDGREIHATLYPPHHPRRVGPSDAAPPYIVWAHAGPGLRAPAVLNLEIAYFTSRGLGIADVNYGGTPGFGRAYRERLRGQWGVVDVEDCASVARALLAEQRAGAVAIRGLSAGGFTAAASLISTDIYACAAMVCPLLDLRSVAAGQTHDFETHYLDWLIGPPDQHCERYQERSPAAHPERISVPFVMLQGAEDVICPPQQSQEFLERLRAAAAVPHVHRIFEGEGHGFRRLATIAESLEAELSLYARVFGFTPPDVPVARFFPGLTDVSPPGRSFAKEPR